jgi:NADPH:quinone reductase-like Zn-dependent oxidoreductase
MKAAVYHQYGGPEVVSITDIDKPIVQDNDVLIRVYASTVNRTDTGFRSAQYIVSRLFSGIVKPKNPVLGCDFAGEIVEVGKSVTQFQIGDRVFGFDDQGFGAHAEYKVISADASIAHIPKGLAYTEAAALAEGGHYALCDIRAAGVVEGQYVMVYGATGAIGSAAVQLLKYFGAYVVAVCSTKHINLVKSLGADEVIDYTKEDISKTTHRFDLVFDAVGKISFDTCKSILKDRGIYISTELGPNLQNPFLAITTSFRKGKKVLFPLPTVNQADIVFLKELVEQGKYRAIIDKTYLLDDIVAAHQYVDMGHKVGNVVIII